MTPASKAPNPRLIARRYARGTSLKELGRLFFDDSVLAARTAVIAGGGKIRSRGRRLGSSKFKAAVPEMRRLYKDQWSLREIAALYETTPETVSTLLEGAGEVLRPRGSSASDGDNE